MSKVFNKKIFTLKLFIKDVVFLTINLPKTFEILFNPNINKIFMEKIMTVVTAVNGCTYCAWFHTRQAAAIGISNEEIKNMLNLQFRADATDHELTGLLYAQHYAETDRKPDINMTNELLRKYGDKTAKHINFIIRMIYFGNLSGNTFDAFLNKLK